jgi:hypothetical protein
MKGFLLQDWLTLRGAAGASVDPIVQSQPFWLDLSAYRDVIAWLEVAEITVDAGKNLLLSYQTAPFEDELLFNAMSGPFTMTTGVTVTQMLADRSPPLAKFFRWKIEPSAGTAAVWDVTFRILIAVNRPGYRRPEYGGPGGSAITMGGLSSSGTGVSSTIYQGGSGGTSGSGYGQLPINIPKKLGT